MSKARFRDIVKVEIQFLMNATASNLKKMARMLDVSEIKDRIANEFTDFVQAVKDVLWNSIKKEVFQVS